MKALAKTKPEIGLWMETRPVPEIGPEDVLIKVHKPVDWRFPHPQSYVYAIFEYLPAQGR